MTEESSASKFIKIETSMTKRERMLASRVNLLEYQVARMRREQEEKDTAPASNIFDEVKQDMVTTTVGDVDVGSEGDFELFNFDDLRRLQLAKFSQDHLREKFRRIPYECRIRKLVGSSAENIDAVAALGKKYANFRPFLDEYVLPQLKLQLLTGEPVQLQNYCLVGPPGVGKTAFLTELSEVLDIGGRIFDASSIQTSATLNGLTRNFGNADVGLMFQTMVFDRNKQCQLLPANALFCIDEVEKVGQTDQLGSTQDLLLALLEPQTAKRFVDAAAPEMSINLEHLNWAFTSNSLEAVSGPLRSRLVHVEIPKPTPEQSLGIAKTIFDQEIARLSGKLDLLPQVNPNDLEVLCDFSPREQKQVLKLAIARAVSAGHRRLSLQLPNQKTSVRMGFL
jgi:ATPase family associated with various cellular activities (AAA)